MTEPSSLFQELKRRRVFRVAAVYIVAGLAVIEGADLVLPRLGLPDWTVTLVVVLVLLGLPLTVALAWAFDVTPEGIRRAPPRGPVSGQESAGGWRWVAAAVGLVVIGGAAAWFVARGGEPAPEIDPDAVAVLPFRVGGAAESLSWLREGTVDMLAAKLTGEAGPRAVNPRTMLTAWRSVSGPGEALPPEEAMELARSVGAGMVLVGDVVGTAETLTIRAELIDAETGTATQAEQSGSVDNLTVMMDRLAATLMALEAGERRPRLDQLTTTSLPALRSYLQGRSAYRAARYSVAADRFDEALAEDSTFALAAMAMAEALQWWAERPGGPEALRLAWRHRDRLSERDRTYLNALAGPNYPAPSSRAQLLDAYQRALDRSPDDPELWYHVGDILYHSGAQLGLDRPLERSATHIERALSLDPAFAPAAEHLFALSLRMGDTEMTRRVGQQYLSMGGDAEGTIRWWLGRVDPSAIDSVPTLAELGNRDLQRILGWAVDGALAVDSIEVAVDLLEERLADSGTPFQVQQMVQRRFFWEWRRGRLARAREIQGPLAGLVQSFDAPVPSDVVAAGKAAGEALLDSIPAGAEFRTLLQYFLAGRSLLEGDPAPARSLMRTLENRVAEDAVARPTDAFLALLLDAELAVHDGRPDAATRVAELERRVREVPPVGQSFTPWFGADLGNLVLMRLYERLGDLEAALAASRRRAFTVGSTVFLVAQVREEGQLAERLGRRDEAIQAYRRYLAFRAPDADPLIREEMDRAQAALQRLTAEGA